MKQIQPALFDTMLRAVAALAANLRPRLPRRAFLPGAAVLAAALVFPAQPAHAQTAPRWTATWGAAPAGPPPASYTITVRDQTIRSIVHTSIGGNRVRIRVSNEMGTLPLRIGSAHIGVRSSGAVVAAGSDRTLTFNGSRATMIAAGAAVWSDAVELNVPALSDMAVSLFLPGTVQATTIHDLAQQINYVSSAGDFTGSPSFPVQQNIYSWPFLTEVDIDLASRAIVAFGDSLTDGVRSTAHVNRRWTDYLARRLQMALGANGRIGVVNRGLSNNQLLKTNPNGMLAGRAGLERFDRDVLATAGVKYVTVLLGINDIGYSNATAARLIDGYRQLIARSRARGVKVYGVTLMPFEGSGYYATTKDSVRRTVNNWIRGSGEFDAVIDFDQAMRDPANSARLLPAYDSGDHLHPNDLGYEKMANSVPLTLFTSLTSAADEAQVQADSPEAAGTTVPAAN
jgi:lysophospholipase L1-like esterase